MQGNVIRGVITESKSGRRAILAKRIIDATGDADMAFRAGAPMRPTPKSELTEVTVNFGCSNVKLLNFMIYTLWKNGKMSDWAAETSGKESLLESGYCMMRHTCSPADPRSNLRME